jgi:hypothetical protein
VTDPDFWSTSAQVIAGLSLATVLEARTLVNTEAWRNSPQISRTITGLLWGAPLLGSAISMPLCLGALDDGPHGPLLASFVRWVLSVNICMLVFTPSITFLGHALASPLARILVPLTKRRRESRRLFRQARRGIRSNLDRAMRQEIALRAARAEHQLTGCRCEACLNIDAVLRVIQQTRDQAGEAAGRIAVLRKQMAVSEVAKLEKQLTWLGIYLADPGVTWAPDAATPSMDEVAP